MTTPDHGPALTQQQHAALHLAHRWFAFLEAPGGDLQDHLTLFHPEVRLTGRRGGYLFAQDHASLSAWLSAVPDAISSHHIVHSTYTTDEHGAGLLNMVVAYQAPGATGTHGSIISYETRIAFDAPLARFVMLDKTPILPNTRPQYAPSWATNRVLALVHGTLAGLTAPNNDLVRALGGDVRHVHAEAMATEGSHAYSAIVTTRGAHPAGIRVTHLALMDDVKGPVPTIERVALLDGGPQRQGG
ncbi:hypothetical protein NY751_11860 [Xanthomonas campestris]|uniref:hypothetical protein n=1 Tax=Xanthomonas campestris TaxID=339 RepID=UPI0023598DE7|nr:hypothetical protein [Xanthomonas campestris]MDC8746755.1 hypothetical protein [Xanthomonas campestris]